MFSACVKSLGEKRIDAAFDNISLLVVGVDSVVDCLGAIGTIIGTVAAAARRLLDDCGLGRISRGFFPLTAVVVVDVVVGVTDVVVVVVDCPDEISKCNESNAVVAV